MMTATQIIESMETRFMPAMAPAGYTCRVHIRLRGSDSGAFTVNVANGACSVVRGLDGRPDAALDADADTYVAVALGKQRIEWAVLRGRIKIDGIPAMRIFSKLFRQPG